jgi:hypothetical protein
MGALHRLERILERRETQLCHSHCGLNLVRPMLPVAGPLRHGLSFEPGRIRHWAAPTSNHSCLNLKTGLRARCQPDHAARLPILLSRAMASNMSYRTGGRPSSPLPPQTLPLNSRFHYIKPIQFYQHERESCRRRLDRLVATRTEVGAPSPISRRPTADHRPRVAAGVITRRRDRQHHFGAGVRGFDSGAATVP